jgi:TonB family protein
MPTRSLFAVAGSRSIPVFVSIAVHAALAIAAVEHAAAPTAVVPGPADVEVEVEPPPSPDEVHREPTDDRESAHPRAEPPPSHHREPDARKVEHRVSASEPSLAAAPSVVASSDHDLPRFSIVLGQATAPVGGSTGAQGTGDGSGASAGSSGNGNGKPARGPADQGDAPVPEAMVSERARLVSALRPEYPPAARAQAVEATVSLEIVVDREGSVAEARVVRGAGYGFEESAVRALLKARFSPARRNNQPVRVRMQWTVDFRLE